MAPYVLVGPNQEKRKELQKRLLVAVEMRKQKNQNIVGLERIDHLNFPSLFSLNFSPPESKYQYRSNKGPLPCDQESSISQRTRRSRRAANPEQARETDNNINDRSKIRKKIIKGTERFRTWKWNYR